MDWYRRSGDSDARVRIKQLFDDVYGGMPEEFETRRLPTLTDQELREVEESLLSARERNRLKNIEEKRQAEEDELLERDLPAEILRNFEVRRVLEDDVLTRYVWGSREEVQLDIENGLVMNGGHSSLPSGWFYLHVGDEDWIPVLSRDYGRGGEVCELEISELPDGFFLVDDVDIMDKTDTPYSEILISKFRVIPKNCITISRIIDSDKMMDGEPQYDY